MGIFHDVLDALGLVETIDETPEKPVEAANAPKGDSRIVSMNPAPQRAASPALKSNLVAIPQSSREKNIGVKKAEENINAKVVLKEPTQFEEAQNIADDLLAGKAVILNIENCAADIAAKLVDFIGGVIYAIGGDIQKITDDTLVAAPANIDIAKDITGATDSSDVGTEVFAWLNKYNQRGDFQ